MFFDQVVRNFPLLILSALGVIKLPLTPDVLDGMEARFYSFIRKEVYRGERRARYEAGLP